MTMTTAGLCGLLITGMDLEDDHKQLNNDGVDPNCGVYKENVPVARRLKWIGDDFPADPKTAEEAGKRFSDAELDVPFYGLYGIERAGRLSGEASSAATTGTASAVSAWSTPRSPTAPGAPRRSTARRPSPRRSHSSSSARAARRC